MSGADGQLLMQAFALMQGGNIPEAERSCLRVLERDPGSRDGLHLLALLRQQQGRLDEALMLVDRALSLPGSNYSIHATRGAVLRALGRLDEAVASFRRAIELAPRAPQPLCQLGATLQMQGRWAEALTVFGQVLEFAPDHAQALDGAGLSSLELGDLEGAEAQLRAAIGASADQPPLRANALNNLGKVLWEQERLEDALRCYEQAADLTPRSLPALANLGHTALKMGLLSEARAGFDRAYRLKPSAALQIQRDMMLPRVLESGAQVQQCRVEFERGMQQVLAAHPGPQPVARELFCDSLFYLAFHGLDDREIMRKVADFYARLCPELVFSAPHVGRDRAAAQTLRLGFFTVNVEDHAVSRCYAKLISLLARDPRFEVVLISTKDPQQTRGFNPYEGFAGRFVRVERQFTAARDVLSALELDVLVYQDIGMDDLSYFLACSRLARAQCVLGGHPVTTGLPQMDYYISTALAEPEEAQEYYSETLLLLQTLPVIFRRPALPAVMKGREGFGLPGQGALYVCPMKLQKMHPDFDAAIEAILRRDPQGHVVLFRDKRTHWERLLEDRLRRSIPDAALRRRIIFLPWLHDYDDFLAINALADVVLDPFHFGIGSTVIATFATATPIVTRPSRFLRGRAGLAYCRLVDAMECVTEGVGDYVERAVALAHDPALRESVRAKIARNSHRLFDNEAPVQELADLMTRIGERVRQSAH